LGILTAAERLMELIVEAAKGGTVLILKLS
jgi:hypothetical protein